MEVGWWQHPAQFVSLRQTPCCQRGQRYGDKIAGKIPKLAREWYVSTPELLLEMRVSEQYIFHWAPNCKAYNLNSKPFHLWLPTLIFDGLGCANEDNANGIYLDGGQTDFVPDAESTF